MAKVTADGVGIDYEIRGSGPPLLMITGFRRSRVIWGEPLLAPLAEKFTLVLPDNRGTGFSDKPQDGYSTERFADDAAAVARHAGFPSAHVFGVSMGGMIAQRVATRHPGLVRGLALGCTIPGGDLTVEADKEIWELLRILPDATMDARAVARKQEAAYFTDKFRESGRAIIDEQFDVVNRNPTPDFAVKGHMAAIDNFDGSRDLDKITAPTLVIAGEGDRLTVPENSTVLADKIKGAKLVILKDAAHFFWVEQAEETARQLTQFFQSLGE